MGLAQLKAQFTPEQYYQLERSAEYKSDYYKGEIFAMAGGSIRHSRICSNILREVGRQVKEGSCEPFESNLRLVVQSNGLRCYPDVSIYCGAFEYDCGDPQTETATNPTILFEVLSKSTESIDRGLKAFSYRTIRSLQMYILVSQDEPKAEVHRRQADGKWTIEDVVGLDATIAMPGICVELPMAEIYHRVDFNAVEADHQPVTN